jgi:uncharacterized protein YecE (DUF72 family)
VTSFGCIEGVDGAARTIARLGDRAGPVRVKVQQARDDGFLRLLLDSLDPELLWAVDFRHESWLVREVAEQLDARGVARVGADEGGAAFRYLRLRNPPYNEADLASEAERVRTLLDTGLDVYAFFKHEDEPTAPAYARRLLERAAVPASA